MTTTETVKFNVGGQRYEVSTSLLTLHPNTMLAKCASEQWQQDKSQEIFIDRSGAIFEHVLNYLRDGVVALPITVRKVTLLKELEYYGVENVDESAIDDGNREAKPGYNFALLKRKLNIHLIVGRIMEEFMKKPVMGTFDLYFYRNTNVYNTLEELYDSKIGIYKELNEDLQKVGLEVTKIILDSNDSCVEMKVL